MCVRRVVCCGMCVWAIAICGVLGNMRIGRMRVVLRTRLRDIRRPQSNCTGKFTRGILRIIECARGYYIGSIRCAIGDCLKMKGVSHG